MLNALAQILPFCKERAVVIEAGTALAAAALFVVAVAGTAVAKVGIADTTGAGKGTAEGSDDVVASLTRSGANFIKRFSLEFTNVRNKLECLSIAGLFSFSAFVGESGAYPSKVPFSFSTLAYAPCLTHKH